MSLILLAVLFCSCNPSPIFRDNFESDKAGNPPLRDPPGDPVGDRIFIASDLDRGIPNPAQVISTGAIEGKSLLYSNIDISGLVREVIFISREITPTAPKYVIIWKGRLQNVTDATSPLVFRVGSREVGTASLKIDDGQFFVKRAGIPDEFEPIGRVNSDFHHSVLFRIDNRAGTYALVILQGGDTFTVGPRPLEDRAQLIERTLQIEMKFDQENLQSHSAAGYVIDDISIDEEETGTR